MEDKARETVEKEVKPATLSRLRQWGESPLPPTVLATLITAQHLRPFRLTGLLFPAALLGSTYMNLNGAPVEAAGTSAAWAGLYALLARRRRQTLRGRWSVRGAVRGATLLGCLVQVAAGGWVYATGKGLAKE